MSEEKLKERLCGKCQTWFPQRSAWDEWCDACDLKDEQRCRCDEIISCDSCGGVALCSFCKDNPPEKVEMIPRAWWERLKAFLKTQIESCGELSYQEERRWALGEPLEEIQKIEKGE